MLFYCLRLVITIIFQLFVHILFSPYQQSLQQYSLNLLNFILLKIVLNYEITYKIKFKILKENYFILIFLPALLRKKSDYWKEICSSKYIFLYVSTMMKSTRKVIHPVLCILKVSTDFQSFFYLSYLMKWSLDKT